MCVRDGTIQKFGVLVLLGSWPFGSTYWVLSSAIPKIFINFKILVLSPSPRYWVLLYLSSEFKVLDYSGQCSNWKLFDLHFAVWSLPYYIFRLTLIDYRITFHLNFGLYTNMLLKEILILDEIIDFWRKFKAPDDP